MTAVSHESHIPLAIEVYESIMPIFEVAMGIYFQSTYYVARRPQYKAETVHFDRFCYDFISLFGVNLLFTDIVMMENIIRKVYHNVSFNFDGVVKLRALGCVEEAFTEKDLTVAHALDESNQLNYRLYADTDLPTQMDHHEKKDEGVGPSIFG